jgi:SsrA-binding protein
MAEGEKTVVSNKKAFHDYFIEERYEAGLVLQGHEVKALREGRGHIREAYATVKDGEALLLGMHVSPYSSVSTHIPVDPLRPRKLLLRRDEIKRLQQQTLEKGLTLVPLRVYFTHGLAKVEIGVARGKKAYDRRRDIAEREAKREMDRTRRRVERS